MFKPKPSHVFTIILFFIASCKPSGKDNLPLSTGKPGTLVVVSDESTLTSLNSDLESCFIHPVNDSSGTDAFFEILKPSIPDFMELFSNQKTILVLVTDDNHEQMEKLLSPFKKDLIRKQISDPKSDTLSTTDLFARHQHIVYLFGKDVADLRNKLKTHQESVLKLLLEFELKDQSGQLLSDTGNNEKYYNLLKAKYGIGVSIPGSFKLNKETDNFYWFQMDTNTNGRHKSLGLIIHAYPYRDSSDFSYENIRSRRDTICKHHIFGEIPGTYMGTTESDYYPKRKREMLQLNSRNACKIKGWWTIRGITMAGPFVRYVVHVPEKKLIFAFEGYIYSPDLIKRDPDIRLIEAIALTIQ